MLVKSKESKGSKPYSKKVVVEILFIIENNSIALCTRKWSIWCQTQSKRWLKNGFN